MKKMIKTIYVAMQEHYLSFRLLVFLKELGITRRINYYLHKSSSVNEEDLEKMNRSREYFTENKERVDNAKSILADQKSKDTLDACINYRCSKTAIPSELVSENDQYLVEGIIKLEKDEVIVDGGAYTGDTIQQLIDYMRKKRIKSYQIIAFEPSQKYYLLLTKFFGKAQNIKLINRGLSDRYQVLFFVENGATSRIADDTQHSDYEICVDSIDCTDSCKKASYIKMDIEGAEMLALQGAKATILKNRPKLAICIYHSDEDMIRIIEYIHELVPEYRLFVRHHSKREVETVLYAVQ